MYLTMIRAHWTNMCIRLRTCVRIRIRMDLALQDLDPHWLSSCRGCRPRTGRKRRPPPLPNSTAGHCCPPSWCRWRSVGCALYSLGITTVEDSKPASYSARFIIYSHTSKANNRLKQNGLIFPVFSAPRVWRIYCPQTRTLITNILRDMLIFIR